jgi:XTP/dITP diphosphohydrolase
VTVQLVLATHNAHKVVELKAILGPLLDGIDLVAYDGPEPVEDGATFEANALIKARAAALHTGMPAIADDSGISVNALDGQPGIHSARYAGTRDDSDNLHLLLENLGDNPDRAAYFTCAAALVVPAATPQEFVELGIWRGTILAEPTGPNGFGYDPIFKPNGLPVSSAELRPDEKNAISHRALAFRALMPIVRRELL